MSRPSIGAERVRIAPLLTPEQLSEMLALAEFQVTTGHMLAFNRSHTTGILAELIALKVVQARKPPPDSQTISTGNTWRVTLTELGWLVLLDRAREALADILPPEPEVEPD